MYRIEFLPKEKWQGFLLNMDYQTHEYYDISISASAGGFEMKLEKKTADPPIVHTSEEYDFPDSLYQPHRQSGGRLGSTSGGFWKNGKAQQKGANEFEVMK